MYKNLHVTYPLFLPHFNQAWIFSADFPKILKYQISRKSVQCQPSSFMRTDRQTDRHVTKTTTAFSDSANAPKKLFKAQQFSKISSDYTNKLIKRIICSERSHQFAPPRFKPRPKPTPSEAAPPFNHAAVQRALAVQDSQRTCNVTMQYWTHNNAFCLCYLSYTSLWTT